MASTKNTAPNPPNVPKQSFVRRNLVAIVMIPAIIGIHYGWSLMQNNRKLVSEDEQIEQPLIIIAKRAWARISDNSPGEKVPTVSAAK